MIGSRDARTSPNLSAPNINTIRCWKNIFLSTCTLILIAHERSENNVSLFPLGLDSFSTIRKVLEKFLDGGHQNMREAKMERPLSTPLNPHSQITHHENP